MPEGPVTWVDPSTGRAAIMRPGHTDLGKHPLQVVSAWAHQLAVGDLDGALALYSPDAVLHLDNVALVSARHIGRRLEALPVFASGRLPSVRGGQDLVVARWEAPHAKEEPLEVSSRIRHGVIAEQWIGEPGAEEAPKALESAFGPVPLATVTHGDVQPDALDYAVGRVQQVIERVEDPVLAIRIKLSMAPDPARSRPALAEASLDVNGQVVRSHVAAHELHEAVDLLVRRLADRLDHRAQRIEALRRHTPGQEGPGSWRHTDLPSVRPEFFDRLPGDRRLVRHKAFFSVDQTVDEAIFDMDLLDYDFYLFCDLAAGQDSLLERLADGTYRLHRLHPVAGEEATSASAVQTNPMPAPVLTVDEAIERLQAAATRFVFFASRQSGRGEVVYQRYDGHYGLITLG